MERYLLLAEGFEEIEATTIMDVLARGGVPVTKVAISGVLQVKGAHGVTIHADTTIDEVTLNQEDAVILPGGLPGAEHLWKSEKVLAMVAKCFGNGAMTAAICAAPAVLAKAGVLAHKKATCYPGFEETVKGFESTVSLTDQAVVIDGNVMTSRGPATAMEFSLALVAHFAGQEKADEVRAGLLAPAAV